MLIKLTMLLIFFAVMLAIGLYCRKTASDVNGFVPVSYTHLTLPTNSRV